ncbi:MAG TPA: DNA recombination protein RmuC [Bacteroidales bacterium]|jgi:DNA recombination protein RmuC|nr:DNA recombination protein RmuC [Bacteroidales bacterium]HNT48183.1 DNA recombination protein RmuC [Bacteroidales bacterium]HNZ46668.1 DNA recombination protein RmuC [Bacteroidales bacterium]HOD56738.1 DNA recombination protein RmuC [Bacteroidales bacterium]HOG32951.1 DNA recombination protein RmuC [Bacteroidales bacterium]
MDAVSIVAGLSVGIIAGGVIVWGLINRRLQAKDLEVKAKEQQIGEKEREIRELGAGMASARTALDLKEKELADTQKQLIVQFENLANKILEANTLKFEETSKQSMQQLLKPLGEQLVDFKSRVDAAHIEDTKQRSTLEERIRGLIEQTNQVSAQANNLAEALKGSPKTQGNWGEMVLERILEQSGLEKDTHYMMQESFRNEQGNVLYPDVVIHLPGERNIIVDSKVSLVAYDRYVSAASQQLQQQALQEHILSIKKHVDELAAKQYDSFQGSLDFVMMFVPVEPAYLIAIQNDPGMWSYAYHKRIVLISPTNLIACLKLMSDLWSREMQNKNAMQIARRGELMLKKFENFIETLSALGGTIAKSQEAYDKAMGQLRDGQGNLIGQASKLRELGIKAFKDLPEMIAED